ncbi:hypothetical protein [Crateriforma spongiae]|uniref:hypothetical protein n=1 Tax=Crateriforma spongiae TaxID=2724528 RepID=UPI0039B02320
MRNLFIIGLLVVGASTAGWFTIEKDGEDTGIKFDTSEIKSDLSKLRERGREYLDKHRTENGEGGQGDEASWTDQWRSQPDSGYDDRNQAYQDDRWNDDRTAQSWQDDRSSWDRDYQGTAYRDDRYSGETYSNRRPPWNNEPAPPRDGGRYDEYGRQPY